MWILEKIIFTFQRNKQGKILSRQTNVKNWRTKIRFKSKKLSNASLIRFMALIMKNKHLFREVYSTWTSFSPEMFSFTWLIFWVCKETFDRSIGRRIFLFSSNELCIFSISKETLKWLKCFKISPQLSKWTSKQSTQGNSCSSLSRGFKSI